MREIQGKLVFDTLEEIVNPKLCGVQDILYSFWVTGIVSI